MDITLALMCGTDIPVPELQLVFHQPKLKEISYIGEDAFFKGLQLVTIDKNFLFQDNSLLEDTTNFQIFMTIIQDQNSGASKKEVVKNLFQLVFPEYSLIISPQSLLLKREGQDTIIIDDNNFLLFQEWFKKIFEVTSGDGQQSFNPGNEKAEEIAKKLMRGRKIAAEQKGGDNSNIFARYISVLTIGLNTMSLDDVINLTMFQLFDLIERYSLHLSWDLDIRAKLAGGGSDSKTEDWMKNIH